MTDALGAHRPRIGAEVDVGVQGRTSLVMRALTEEIIQFARRIEPLPHQQHLFLGGRGGRRTTHVARRQKQGDDGRGAGGERG